MRDLKRIYKILRLIRKIWIANQDLRFFQLIEHIYDQCNFYKDSVDNFYLEDDEFINILEKEFFND